MIAHNRERKPKELFSELGAGEPVRVVEVEDEHAEARFVAAGIAGLVEEGFNGDEIAVRKWDAGPIRKVTRRQKAGAATAIRVVYGNGRIVRVEDKNAIDHALDWTAAQIDEITKKVGKVVDEPPAASRQRGDDDDEK